MLKVRQPLNIERENFQPLHLVPALLCLIAIALALRMTFRIEKATDMRKTIRLDKDVPLRETLRGDLNGERLLPSLSLKGE